MEGPDGQIIELPFTKQALKPLLHLARRLVRERHSQDRLRRRSLADQKGDAVREDARLPRPGAGQDEQGPIAVRYGGALLGIEGVEDGIGQRFDGMCDSGLWTERGNHRERVDKKARGLWRRDFSSAARCIRLLAIPGELASGGGVSADAGASGFFYAVRHDESAVDNVLKS